MQTGHNSPALNSVPIRLCLDFSQRLCQLSLQPDSKRVIRLSTSRRRMWEVGGQLHTFLTALDGPHAITQRSAQNCWTLSNCTDSISGNATYHRRAYDGLQRLYHEPVEASQCTSHSILILCLAT